MTRDFESDMTSTPESERHREAMIGMLKESVGMLEEVAGQGPLMVAVVAEMVAVAMEGKIDELGIPRIIARAAAVTIASNANVEKGDGDDGDA